MDAPATLRARKAILWTREDCERLAAMGLLPERWELVQGEIVSKTGDEPAARDGGATHSGLAVGSFPECFPPADAQY
jgi:hypothetical protein